MSIAVPTADQAQALHEFIQERTEDEWEQGRTDHALSIDSYEAIRRLANSSKLAVGGTTAYLLACIAEGDHDQAARLWDFLTAIGEEWNDHRDWKAEWVNVARAELLR